MLRHRDHSVLHTYCFALVAFMSNVPIISFTAFILRYLIKLDLNNKNTPFRFMNVYLFCLSRSQNKVSETLSLKKDFMTRKQSLSLLSLKCLRCYPPPSGCVCGFCVSLCIKDIIVLFIREQGTSDGGTLPAYWLESHRRVFN